MGAVARSVEHPAPATSFTDLSVPATISAPATFSAGGANGGPPAPVASAGDASLALAGVAHTSEIAFAGRPNEVAVRLAAPPCAAVFTSLAAAARGIDGTFRSGIWRSVAPLVPSPARRLRGPAAEGLLAQRRRRIGWEIVGRERLLRAWKGVLREHGLPAGEVRLVGIFGPTPLGALEGVALDTSGEEAIVAFRRTRVPGPTGHVALARHVPTGRLLTVLVEDT